MSWLDDLLARYQDPAYIRQLQAQIQGAQAQALQPSIGPRESQGPEIGPPPPPLSPIRQRWIDESRQRAEQEWANRVAGAQALEAFRGGTSWSAPIIAAAQKDAIYSSLMGTQPNQRLQAMGQGAGALDGLMMALSMTPVAREPEPLVQHLGKGVFRASGPAADYINRLRSAEAPPEPKQLTGRSRQLPAPRPVSPLDRPEPKGTLRYFPYLADATPREFVPDDPANVVKRTAAGEAHKIQVDELRDRIADANMRIDAAVSVHGRNAYNRPDIRRLDSAVYKMEGQLDDLLTNSSLNALADVEKAKRGGKLPPNFTAKLDNGQRYRLRPDGTWQELGPIIERGLEGVGRRKLGPIEDLTGPLSLERVDLPGGGSAPVREPERRMWFPTPGFATNLLNALFPNAEKGTTHQDIGMDFVSKGNGRWWFRPTQKPIPQERALVPSQYSGMPKEYLNFLLPGAPKPQEPQKLLPGAHLGQKRLGPHKGPLWFSPLKRAIETLPLKVSPEQMAAHLKKHAGTSEEADWIGLGDFLKGKKSVTKADIIKYIQENSLELTETQLKEGARTYSSEDGFQPMELFEDYTDGGGSNYRVFLLHAKGKNVPEFNIGHFSRPNVLVHVRAKDRGVIGGGKALDANEIQSDLHEAGRERGYRDPTKQAELAAIDAEIREATRARGMLYRELAKVYTIAGAGDAEGVADILRQLMDRAGTEEERDQIRTDWLRWTAASRNLHDAQERSRALENPSALPNTPYKKTWPMLAIRRMLREAAEKGYDWLTWATGAQNNKTFGLSQVGDELTIVRYPATPENLQRGIIDKYSVVLNKDGHNVAAETVEESKLKDYIGEHAANKAMNHVGSTPLVLTGKDLELGGQGMKKFYDEMLVNEANKFLKKFGVRVEKVKVEGTSTTYQHSTMTITPRWGSPGKFEVWGGDQRILTPSGDKEVESLDELEQAANSGLDVSGMWFEIDPIEGSVSGEPLSFQEVVDALAEPRDVPRAFARKERAVEENKLERWGVRITPKLRDYAMGGMPMFEPSPVAPPKEPVPSDKELTREEIRDWHARRGLKTPVESMTRPGHLYIDPVAEQMRAAREKGPDHITFSTQPSKTAKAYINAGVLDPEDAGMFDFANRFVRTLKKWGFFDPIDAPLRTNYDEQNLMGVVPVKDYGAEGAVMGGQWMSGPIFIRFRNSDGSKRTFDNIVETILHEAAHFEADHDYKAGDRKFRKALERRYKQGVMLAYSDPHIKYRGTESNVELGHPAPQQPSGVLHKKLGGKSDFIYPAPWDLRAETGPELEALQNPKTKNRAFGELYNRERGRVVGALINRFSRGGSINVPAEDVEEVVDDAFIKLQKQDFSKFEDIKQVYQWLGVTASRALKDRYKATKEEVMRSTYIDAPREEGEAKVDVEDTNVEAAGSRLDNEAAAQEFAAVIRGLRPIHARTIMFRDILGRTPREMMDAFGITYRAALQRLVSARKALRDALKKTNLTAEDFQTRLLQPEFLDAVRGYFKDTEGIMPPNVHPTEKKRGRPRLHEKGSAGEKRTAKYRRDLEGRSIFGDKWDKK